VDSFQALDIAQSEFSRRLRAVSDATWEASTPCNTWTVRDLVDHLIMGNIMTVRLLGGASTEEAMEQLPEDRALRAGREPHAAFVDSADEQARAFREPDAMDRTVHHPAMDMAGAQLLGFRTGDLALHAWDLARAIGADEELDGGLVGHVWEGFQPLALFIGDLGVFGTGPSGRVGEDAPLQRRLLDLTGRRP
jgi:uncharacterized protein (TIGR03086 family)